MHYNSKYLELTLSDKYDETLPKLYLNWYFYRGNLKLSYSTYDRVVVDLGMFNKYLYIVIKWNHTERAMTEEEQDLSDRMKNFIKGL